MPTASTLVLFSIAVLGLLVSPGPNMAMVVSQSLSLGARGGVASAAGIFVADLILTLLVCAGIAAAAAAWPPSFDVLRWAGAAYLVGLAWKTLRRRDAAPNAAPAQDSSWRALRSAVIVSLLNPKALLFFLVFLPQFADPRRGGVTVQLLILGLVLSALAFVFHALLGVCAGRVVAALRTRAHRLRWLDRVQAAVLLGLALRLVLLQRPLQA
ncbi:LysE family translocator [Tahibacter soli]|uniref:LysE family translocator n=1 Tax=Tahibacter soli TaxID=2983605 RepID=A0A9X3YSL0_9GAMM|nr:LysE family translocator [Tahibacter soli]MDC8016223.1 LysE family translocator [Tahibacter soli]